MKMIRKFQILLSILLVVFYMGGCGTTDKNNEGNDNNAENVGDTGDVADTEDTEDTENTEDKKAGEEGTNGLGTGLSSEKAEISEQVLFDQENLKITAISLDEEGFLGPEIKVQIENNTEVDLTFQVKNVSVNGYMVEPSFSSDVAAGKKANDNIIFLSKEFETSNIKSIVSIELQFNIFKTDTWDTLIISDPIVLETSINGNYNQEYNDTGNIVYEGEGFKIVEKGLDTSDDIMGPLIWFYIENNSESLVTVQTRDVSVNGFMVEPALSTDIVPGKKVMDGLMFLDLEDNDIDKIEEVQLKFDIFDTEGWETIVETDVINLSFKE